MTTFFRPTIALILVSCLLNGTFAAAEFRPNTLLINRGLLFSEQGLAPLLPATRFASNALKTSLRYKVFRVLHRSQEVWQPLSDGSGADFATGGKANHIKGLGFFKKMGQHITPRGLWTYARLLPGRSVIGFLAIMLQAQGLEPAPVPGAVKPEVLRRELTALPKDLQPYLSVFLSEVSALPPAAAAATESAIYRIVNALNKDLNSKDVELYATPVDGTFHLAFYRIRPDEGEYYTLSGGATVIHVRVLPMTLTAGYPMHFLALSNAAQNTILVNESRPGADRQAFLLHEFFHLWFARLPAIHFARFKIKDVENEYAAYLGQVARTKDPYAALLKLARQIPTRPSIELTGFEITAGVVKVEIMRVLAARAAGLLKDPKDRASANRLAVNSSITRNDAEAFVKMLRIRKIAPAVIQKQAADVYQGEIGDFFTLTKETADSGFGRLRMAAALRRSP
jgi:hypothetical protein